MDAHKPLPADLRQRAELLVDKHTDFIAGFSKVGLLIKLCAAACVRQRTHSAEHATCLALSGCQAVIATLILGLNVSCSKPTRLSTMPRSTFASAACIGA